MSVANALVVSSEGRTGGWPQQFATGRISSSTALMDSIFVGAVINTTAVGNTVSMVGQFLSPSVVEQNNSSSTTSSTTFNSISGSGIVSSTTAAGNVIDMRSDGVTVPPPYWGSMNMGQLASNTAGAIQNNSGTITSQFSGEGIIAGSLNVASSAVGNSQTYSVMGSNNPFVIDLSINGNSWRGPTGQTNYGSVTAGASLFGGSFGSVGITATAIGNSTSITVR